MESSLREVVFVPTPGMGHLLSAVAFAKLIIKHNQQISILILIINVPLTSSIITSFVDSQSRDNPYPTRLKFHTLPTLSNQPDQSSPNFFQTLIELHKPLVKQAVEDHVQVGSINQLCGFILDMFCTTMVDVAIDFKVSSYVFFPSGASLLTMMFHFQSLCDDQGFDIASELSNPDAEFEVPGFVTRVPSKVIPGVFKEGVDSMMFSHARRFRSCNGILVNTFTELETYPLKALFDQVMVKDGGISIPPIYPVGPILELDNRSSSGSHGEEHESIMLWLNDQPTSSVVFLCFGSMGCFGADQVLEIAKGLENSRHRFLWSLRQPPPEGKVGMPSQEPFIDALPEGFEDRTADRGKVIGWAPQVSILGHQAVGGFVSHCGWNSTLESLWFGIPMATWPLYAEQQLNAFEVVKELGLAVEIRMDHRLDWKTRQSNFQVSAEEIENGVKKLMSMDDESKEKVREMRDKGRKALEDGGSSHQWLGRFIENVVSNVY